MDKRKESISQRQSGPSQAALSPSAVLGVYRIDLDRWASSWAGFPELDIPIGNGIVEEFRSFLLALIEDGSSRKTTKRYADYLWALGGEVIRHVNGEPSDRNFPARELLLRLIDKTGGPAWPHAYDARDLDAYHSACRRLYRFMAGTRRQ
jgi:hypothetical protein